MFNTQSYTSIIFATVVSVVFVLVIFNFQLLGESHSLEKLDKQELLWKKNKPQRFSYKVTRGCMFGSSVEVMHADGVNHYKYSKENSPKSNIDYLFLELRRAFYEANSVKVSYNYMGYPESYRIDWSADTYDNKCFSKINEFRVY